MLIIGAADREQTIDDKTRWNLEALHLETNQPFGAINTIRFMWSRWTFPFLISKRVIHYVGIHERSNAIVNQLL